MVAYLSAGFIGAIVTGLITKPQPKEQLDSFFENLKKPVDKEEKLATDTM